MHSFLLVFLDSVSSSWPVFVLLYLSFCVNKGQAACSAWHGSQLCVRNSVRGFVKKKTLNVKLGYNKAKYVIAPQGFGREAKTRGGTLGVPVCIHTRTKNIC